VKNEGGHRRTLDEALDLARAEGVDVDDDALVFKLFDGPLPNGDGAIYLSSREYPEDHVFELRGLTNKAGKIVVTVSAMILDSDEEIIHVLAHEVFELRALVREFEANGGRLSAKMLHSLVHPPEGTLHCAAWKYADALLESHRGQGNV
jgi:hypothetical protein